MKYVSNSVISFSIQINGKDKRVRFSPVMDGGSSYITNEAAEIAALEGLSSFERGMFRRAPGRENEENEPKAAPKKESKAAPKVGKTDKKGKAKVTEGEMTRVEEVATLQEAAEYLIDQCGSGGEGLTDPDAILEEAGKRGVVFPNLK